MTTSERRIETRLRETRSARVLEIMRTYRDRLGFHNWDLVSGLCGFGSVGTFRNRLKNPENLTRGEMRNIIIGLRIPDEEIRPYI